MNLFNLETKLTPNIMVLCSKMAQAATPDDIECYLKEVTHIVKSMALGNVESFRYDILTGNKVHYLDGKPILKFQQEV